MIAHFMRSIFGPTIGGGVAGTIGFLVAWRTRRRDGRDRFLAVMGEFEAELHGSADIDDRPQKIHAQSIIPLRLAVFAVQPFISKRRFKRLLSHWDDYAKYNPDPLKAASEQAAHDPARGDPLSRPAYPADVLRAYFKKFRKEVG